MASRGEGEGRADRAPPLSVKLCPKDEASGITMVLQIIFLKWGHCLQDHRLKNWPPASLHQIGATVHIPMDLAIDAARDADPETNLLGP